ncbi:MAG: class I SAM-dependent methyltransferase, partial [Spirochaetaceae bacterium]|nr:class I SAM-dependent methyltransferase [Spirochaetaceae bacterium]
MAEEWFEKENFWLEYGPIMFDSQHWAEAPGVAEAVCKIAGLSAGSSILDACCGPGRISVELALLGLKVTGVDIMQSFLDAAKDTADDEGVPLVLIRADMRT